MLILKSRKKKTVLVLMMMSITSLSVSGCDLAANYTKSDRAADMQFQDFRDGLAERQPELEDTAQRENNASIPELQPYVSLQSEGIQAMPLVSVSVNQSVPLRDLLYELAEQADYDLELDPNIRGSIIFRARNKPFDVVVRRVAELAGLRYDFSDGFLRVEVDHPFNKTYSIDYINIIRSNQANVNTSVSVLSDSESGAKTGSDYSLSSDATSDFWAELELNLTQILGGGTTGVLKTSRDPRITAVTQAPDVATVAPDGSEAAQPPAAVLRVDSLPVDDLDGVVGGDATTNQATFSLNKQGGMLSVFATESQHKEVASYMKKLETAVTSQILIEAKVFEVSLFDEFITGIRWQSLFDGEFSGGLVDTDAGNSLLDFVGNGSNILSSPTGDIADAAQSFIGYAGNDFAALIEAVSGYGTVRALASPRLTVMNNQPAVLNVATNRVYFEIDIEREEGEDGESDRLSVDSEIKTVPEGVLINVQPSVNLQNRTISMFVRPTVTRIVNRVPDPSVQFFAGDEPISSSIPEVNVQEIDTVVRVNSGQPIVMGGLIQDRIDNSEQGVPVLSEIPLFGSAFKQKKDLIRKTELVIFLKATLLDSPSQTIHNTDRDLYRQFSGDRRPFKL